MTGIEPAAEASTEAIAAAAGPDALVFSAASADRTRLSPAAMPPIVLDISRLLSRAGREAPTGIDRVEMAYARHLTANHGRLAFAAVDAGGRIKVLARDAAAAYIAALDVIWRGDGSSAGSRRQIRQLSLRLRSGALVGRGRWRRRDAEPPIYLLVSHYRLEARGAIARLKRKGARFVCLIHDLIPIEFPEYAKPGQDLRHRQRIETAAALADAVIAGTAAVRDAFQPHMERAGRAAPVIVAPFGAYLPPVPPAAAETREPYFVCVGTIEARKNHLLLLSLWRRLAAELGPLAPRLVLIGQRGWLTQHVVDMLERSPALHGLVIEHNTLPDAAMARLVRGARALLLPSFAEGFGFPVIEALALGVPVLCSDLPALRETGGGVPEYLDPLDGPGWRSAILDYAETPSPRREAQLRRLAGWRPASWQDHFAAVHQLIETIGYSCNDVDNGWSR